MALKVLFRRFIFTLGIALTIFLFGLFPNQVLSFYSNGFYRYLSMALRSISSVFPFALGDILYAIVILFLLRLIFLFVKRVRKSGWQKSDRLIIPISILNTVLIFYICFKILWGLNYSRPTITQQLKISNQKYSVKELVILGNYFIEKLNTLQPKLSSKLNYTIGELRNNAVLNYQDAASKNAFFKYTFPSFKPVINGWLISKTGIEGYYNPFSGEANINMKLPAWVLPFVACHEISHQLGVAREDEANLVAYLVGKDSKDLNFQYSVNYNMLIYILLEIRYKSPEDYLKLKEKINPGLLANFKKENEFWKKYNGQMSNYMGVAFDKFLKMNNQRRGIKSYQNIVIWLWNIHRKEFS